MVELSRFWDSTTPGDAADAPYDSSDMSEVLRALAGAEAVPTDLSGVFRGVDNQLGITLGSAQVTIGSGKAMVDGRYYRNTAPLNLPIANAVPARNDLIVLRKETSLQTVRLAVMAGGGGGALATLTRSAGLWEYPLYQLAVSGSSVTLTTDMRDFIPRHGDVSGEGSAAIHHISQISGAPASGGTPANAGLTVAAAAGSLTGQYANSDHVHRVNAIPSAYAPGLESKTSPGNSIYLTIPLNTGYAHILEMSLLASSSDPGGTMFAGSIAGVLSGGGIGEGLTGNFSSFQVDTSIDGNVFLTGIMPAGASAATLFFGPSPAVGNSAGVNVGSWIRATPIT